MSNIAFSSVTSKSQQRSKNSSAGCCNCDDPYRQAGVGRRRAKHGKHRTTKSKLSAFRVAAAAAAHRTRLTALRRSGYPRSKSLHRVSRKMQAFCSLAWLKGVLTSPKVWHCSGCCSKWTISADKMPIPIKELEQRNCIGLHCQRALRFRCTQIPSVMLSTRMQATSGGSGAPSRPITNIPGLLTTSFR